jgi:hypothetical protein
MTKFIVAALVVLAGAGAAFAEPTTVGHVDLMQSYYIGR